jgi:hypothetical protein
MIAVAGAAIYGAKDPEAAAKGLREKIKHLGWARGLRSKGGDGECIALSPLSFFAPVINFPWAKVNDRLQERGDNSTA